MVVRSTAVVRGRSFGISNPPHRVLIIRQHRPRSRTSRSTFWTSLSKTTGISNGCWAGLAARGDSGRMRTFRVSSGHYSRRSSVAAMIPSIQLISRFSQSLSIDSAANPTTCRQTRDHSSQLAYLRTAIEQGEGGDQRQNLRRRVDLRDSDLILPGAQSTQPLTDTVLDEDWQQYRVQATTSNFETDIVDHWTALSPDAFPGDVWPSPAPFRERIQRPVSSQDLARTLSVLGQIGTSSGDGCSKPHERP